MEDLKDWTDSFVHVEEEMKSNSIWTYWFRLRRASLHISWSSRGKRIHTKVKIHIFSSFFWQRSWGGSGISNAFWTAPGTLHSYSQGRTQISLAQKHPGHSSATLLMWACSPVQHNTTHKPVTLWNKGPTKNKINNRVNKNTLAFEPITPYTALFGKNFGKTKNSLFGTWTQCCGKYFFSFQAFPVQLPPKCCYFLPYQSVSEALPWWVHAVRLPLQNIECQFSQTYLVNGALASNLDTTGVFPLMRWFDLYKTSRDRLHKVGKIVKRRGFSQGYEFKHSRWSL